MTGEHELTSLPRGLRRRMLPTAKLAAKAAVKHALRFGGARPAPRDPAAALVAAATLFEDLGTFKGLFTKFGQLAGYLPGAAPSTAREIVARLHARGTPFAFDALSRVAAEDLGSDLPSLFDGIDRRPIAAASIGQVHRARHGGREVAVKIQYPGIEDALREDLAVLAPFVRLGCFGLPTDAGAMLRELRERVQEECDYRLEARNQLLFARLVRDLPGCSVPEVVAERSGRRVLTTAFSPGADFRTFRTAAGSAARNRAGESMVRACFQGLFRRCVYNGDPHPGNYLFDENGSVSFLDFGCVRRFDPPLIAAWKRLARALLDGDRPRFRREFTALGFVPNPRRFDWEHQFQAFRHLYEPYLARGPWAYGRDFVVRSYDLLIYRNPNALRIAMPPEWLLVQRLQFGLNAILADLRAEARWGEILRDALDAPIDPLPEEPLRRRAAAAPPVARKEARA